MYFDKRLREKREVGDPIIFGKPLERASTLKGKTIGIVGFGRIGKEVARKVKAFDANIIYHDVMRADEASEEALGAKFVSFEELLQTSDYVTVHCPYLPESHHLFDEKAFGMMKQNAYFINVARGKVMDEAALIKALKSGKIKGAALDVFENEPEISEELFEMDNVVLTPHVGSFVAEVRRNMAVRSVDGYLYLFRRRSRINRC